MFFSKNPLNGLDRKAKIALLFLLSKLADVAEAETDTTKQSAQATDSLGTTSSNTTDAAGLPSWLPVKTFILILIVSVCCFTYCISLLDRDKGSVSYSSVHDLENGFNVSSSATPLLHNDAGTQTSGDGSNEDAPLGDDLSQDTNFKNG